MKFVIYKDYTEMHGQQNIKHIYIFVYYMHATLTNKVLWDLTKIRTYGSYVRLDSYFHFKVSNTRFVMMRKHWNM